MKVCIGSDHRGFRLKKEILNYYKDKIDFIDVGTNSEDSADYTTYSFLVGENVRDKKSDVGIVICGTGIGASIACNKVKGVRCSKVTTKEESYLTRRDNDANVLALDGKISLADAVVLIDTFVNTEYVFVERYDKRIRDISSYEKGEYDES